MDKLYFVKINLLAIDEIIRSYNNQGRKIYLSAIFYVFQHIYNWLMKIYCKVGIVFKTRKRLILYLTILTIVVMFGIIYVYIQDVKE